MITTGTTITANITRMMVLTPMRPDASLHKLLAWTSPSYPVGGFTYSHGLETAVDDSRVVTVGALVEYIEAVLARGGGWVDAVLFVHGYRAAGDPAAFDMVAELASAFRGSSETALESHQQGLSFLAVTRKAWPHPALEAFATRWGKHPIAHSVAMALASAAHSIPLEAALHGWLHSAAANLVSAGVRLIPLGQTDGQRATAELSIIIADVARRAQITALDDLGTATPMLELASLHHETLYTRLFRS